MGKLRRDSKGRIYNLETICLECLNTGLEPTKKVSKGWYMEDELLCPVCKTKTKHVLCKSLEELKAKFLFNYNLREKDAIILEKIEKQKIKNIRR